MKFWICETILYNVIVWTSQGSHASEKKNSCYSFIDLNIQLPIVFLNGGNSPALQWKAAIPQKGSKTQRKVFPSLTGRYWGWSCLYAKQAQPFESVFSNIPADTPCWWCHMPKMLLKLWRLSTVVGIWHKSLLFTFLKMCKTIPGPM